MLIFPLICTNCGCQIGAYSLLYLWLRERKFGGSVSPYSEISFEDISAQAGIINDCCWTLVHSAMTHNTLNVGVTMVTSSGDVICGGV